MLREAKLAKKKANRVDYYAVSGVGRWACLTGKGCWQAGHPAVQLRRHLLLPRRCRCWVCLRMRMTTR